MLFVFVVTIFGAFAVALDDLDPMKKKRKGKKLKIFQKETINQNSELTLDFFLDVQQQHSTISQ